jgi:hypothetical protein
MAANPIPLPYVTILVTTGTTEATVVNDIGKFTTEPVVIEPLISPH